MKLLERDLDRRYACAEDVLADLMRCRQMTSNGAGELVGLLSERFPPHAREYEEPGAPGPNTHATASASLASVDREALAPDGMRPRRMVRRRWLAAGVAGLVLGGAVAIALWRSSERAPTGKEGSSERESSAAVVVPAGAATAPPTGGSGSPSALPTLPSLPSGSPRAAPPLAAPSSASGTPSRHPGRGGVRTTGAQPTTPPSGIVEIPLGGSSAARKP